MNAVLCVVLIVTGLRIHFGVRAKPLIPFELAFNLHNVVGAILAVVWIGFVVIFALTGNAHSYCKAPPAWGRGMVRQVHYYLIGVLRGGPHPFHPEPGRRFSPLQQFTYIVVMYVLFPVLALTGVLLLFAGHFPETVHGYRTGWVIGTLHYLVSWAFVLFLIVHLYLITIGDRVSYSLRAMLDGWHRHHAPAEATASEPAGSKES